MSLLFAERPLVINTQLAMKIGLNEAIVLQQLHYWLRDTNSGMECDGVRWIYNTTEQWLEQFPFWSESTLKRAFASLKTLGLLRCEKLNKSKRDMTNFYTINYGSELLDGGKLSESIGSKCAAPSGQNDTMEEVKMKRSIGSKRPNVIGSKWPDDLTENTTEITTEIRRSTAELTQILKGKKPVEALIAIGLEKDVAQRFNEHRKALKKPLTLEGLIKHYHESCNAGISTNDAARIVLSESWIGFANRYNWKPVYESLIGESKSAQPEAPQNLKTVKGAW